MPCKNLILDLKNYHFVLKIAWFIGANIITKKKFNNYISFFQQIYLYKISLKNLQNFFKDSLVLIRNLKTKQSKDEIVFFLRL